MDADAEGVYPVVGVPVEVYRWTEGESVLFTEEESRESSGNRIALLISHARNSLRSDNRPL